MVINLLLISLFLYTGNCYDNVYIVIYCSWPTIYYQYWDTYIFKNSEEKALEFLEDDE